MLLDVTEVRVVGDHKVFLRFEDGKHGIVDLSKIVSFNGVFKPLNDPKYFARVQLSKELGTIYWENGADIAPETLYRAIKESTA